MSNPEGLKPLPVTCDVVIIGAGPAGLATATALKRIGIDKVIVLERESDAGGIPRHCGHAGFGMREFKRWMSGPAYAGVLVTLAKKAGVEIYLNTTVVGIFERGRLSISTLDGFREIKASVVVLATGARETPRAPRLVSGQRAPGILTTGALQSMVYLKHKIPCKRPVIVGTELVSFSALLTCRHAGIKPVAMLEPNSRITARSFARVLPGLIGVPVCLNTELMEIFGDQTITGVGVSDARYSNRTIDCDGVIFSGQFTPESSLIRLGHLEIDQASGGPVVDQYGRCSEPCYVATGNLFRPVESAGWCWQEGLKAAQVAARILRKGLPAAKKKIRLMIRSPLIKYVMPQILVPDNADCAMKHLQLRFNRKSRGFISVSVNNKVVWSKKMSVLPERRVLIPITRTMLTCSSGNIEVNFEER